MKVVNILHFWYSGGIGGSETHILNLAKHSDKNHFSHSVCFLQESGTIGKEIEYYGFNIIELNLKSIYSLRTLKELCRILSDTRIDIVHNHASTPIVPIIAKIYRKKVVYTEHGNVILNKRKVLFHHTLGFIMSLFVDKVIAISRFIKETLITKRNFPRDKITVVYHGVPNCKLSANGLTTPSGFNDEVFYVGALGRCVKQKGFKYFVDLAAEFQRRFSSKHVSFVLAGDGPELPILKKQAELLKLNDRICFLGYRRDVDILLTKFDILVMTSLAEPFGIVAIEGMAASLPIIAFDVNGLNEIILDNRTGFLVKPFDIDELVNKTAFLIKQNKIRKQMGSEASRHFERNFSVDIMVKSTEKIYRDLTTESRKSSLGQI
jgi:glycosyltransferase involved in cell wall biosynthesis